MNVVYPSQFIQTLESTFFILANCSENKKRKMFWRKQVFHKDVTHKMYSYQTSSFKTSILLNTILQNVKFFIFINLLTKKCPYITNNLLPTTYIHAIHIYHFFIFSVDENWSWWLQPPLFNHYGFFSPWNKIGGTLYLRTWTFSFTFLHLPIYQSIIWF